MEIIGNGFLAKHLRLIGHKHPDATVLAAGVPRQELPESEHKREVVLVEQAIEESLRRDRLLVFFSTASIYGGGDSCRGREDEPAAPLTNYGRHKLGLEALIRDSGVRHLTLRLCYMLGPHTPALRLIPSLIAQILSGSVRIYPGAYRDLLHVADAVMIIDKLLDMRLEDEIVNVASGDCVRIELIVDHIEKRLGTTAKREFTGVGTAHCLSVEKLHKILPELGGMDFGPGYYQLAIDRYLRESGHLPGDA
ncbi:NAD-dependent epimerase/dehydratase family protein [Nonomuraea sp. SYSU D8015]|uniref:NAD-dependent epimerase/dehydratase family protein n=1 Tax=Nonomuraea sp. SYSU D8015 TaxID=2593644 RepID=UPI0016601723|nr:NAD-dependent epimerase/dehydratase family protein [Nonomuraea sp. SYSU D8015]